MDIKKIYRDMWVLQLSGHLTKRERKTFKGLMYLFVKYKLQRKQIFEDLYKDNKTKKTFDEWFDDRYIFEIGKGYKT